MVSFPILSLEGFAHGENSTVRLSLRHVFRQYRTRVSGALANAGRLVRSSLLGGPFYRLTFAPALLYHRRTPIQLFHARNASVNPCHDLRDRLRLNAVVAVWDSILTRIPVAFRA